MKKLNQKGFETLTVVGLALILVLLGGIGYYVYSNRDMGSEADTSFVVKEKDEAEEKISDELKDTNSPQKNLDIEEWGVRLTLSSDIQNTTYVFTNSKNNWAYLSTPRLDEISKNSDECSSANQSISINRAKPGDDRFGTPWTEAELKKIGVKVDNFYYFSESGQSCFGETINKKLFNEIGSIRTSLSNAIKTVERTQ